MYWFSVNWSRVPQKQAGPSTSTGSSSLFAQVLLGTPVISPRNREEESVLRCLSTQDASPVALDFRPNQSKSSCHRHAALPYSRRENEADWKRHPGARPMVAFRSGSGCDPLARRQCHRKLRRQRHPGGQFSIFNFQYAVCNLKSAI